MTGRVGRYTRNLVLALQRFGVEISVACNEREDECTCMTLGNISVLMVLH